MAATHARLTTLWACAWACAWATGEGARLVVSAGGNASCAWRVALQDETRPGAEDARFELCTDALPIAFQGLSQNEDSLEVLLGTFSKRWTPSGALDAAGGAPRGYVRIPGGFYKVHEARATWLQAKATCEAEGAHLVVVDSKEEAAQLRTHLQSKRAWWRQRPFTLHAGFHMDFATPSGQSLASLGYEQWAPGQPAAPVCGRIDHDAWLLFGACSEEERFVCEYTSAPAPTQHPDPTRHLASAAVPPQPTASVVQAQNEDAQPEASPSAPQRGSRAVAFRRHALTVLNFRGDPWADARRACAADGAQLAAVEAAAEAELLVDFLQGLPGDEPRGLTLLGLRTARAVDVLGTLALAAAMAAKIGRPW